MGLSAEVWMLLAHNAEGFRDWGMSVSLSFDLSPRQPWGSRRGWNTRGAAGNKAAPRHFGVAAPVSVLAVRGGHVSGGRVLTVLGYGMAIGDRLIGTPRIGFSTSAAGTRIPARLQRRCTPKGEYGVQSGY